MDFLEAVKEAGIVGAGGAGFPTHIKLAAQADTFLVNAAECEPLIETDKYLCRTFADEIVGAVAAIAQHLQVKRAVIALKGKYQPEIAALQDAIARSGKDIEIFKLGTFYPAGDEQTLVQQVTGKSVPERGLPLDVGAVVDNVGTVLNIWNALQGKAVTHKYLSVTGAVAQPIMLHVPLGTAITDCIAQAKLTETNYRVILGGPMMGKVLASMDEINKAVVTKTTGNILVLPEKHYLIERAGRPMERIRKQARSACVQCKMCTDLCPRFLLGHKMHPNLIMRNLYRESIITDNAEYEKAFGEAANCCSCGVCEMFACPMGLSPRKVNEYVKGQLRERGIRPARFLEPTARADVDLHHIPTDRLIARLHLTPYAGKHAKECLQYEPESVFIPFSQHIGKPAVPIVQIGDYVTCGELIAKAAEGGLSANIHASKDGVITEINAAGACICRKEI